MTVTKETLRRMITEFDLIPMSDQELDIILPELQQTGEDMKKLAKVDLSSTRISHVFRADPRS
jgi:hypothetical protein